MGVKKQWRLMKIAELPLAEDVRRELIDKVMRRRGARLALYCWENKEGVAPIAFFSKMEAVKNWYIKNHLWEQKEIPRGVLLYEWQVPLKTIIDHLKDSEITNIPIAEEHVIEVALPLSELHTDIQQTVQNQG